MKMKMKSALSAVVLALAASGAQAALVQPGDANGSDIVLNIWNGDNANQGFTQDLGIQIGTWDPSAAFSLTVTDPGIVAAYNSNPGGTVFDVIASQTSTGTFYTTVNTDNAANLGAGAGDSNFSVESAVSAATTAYSSWAALAGNTFGSSSTGRALSQSSDTYWAATLAAGGGNLSAVTEAFSPGALYFASFASGASEPNVNVYAGQWTLSFNGASGSATAATLSWTPVPLPAAVWLFGSGLLGLAGIGRRRKTT